MQPHTITLTRDTPCIVSGAAAKLVAGTYPIVAQNTKNVVVAFYHDKRRAIISLDDIKIP